MAGRQAENVNKSTFGESQLQWFWCVANLYTNMYMCVRALTSCICGLCVLCLCVLFCLFWRLSLQLRRWLPRGVFAYGRWCPLRHPFWLDSRVLRAVRCQETARGNPTVLFHIFVLVGVHGFPCCPGPTQSQPTLLLCLHVPVTPAPLVRQPFADVLLELVLQSLPVPMVDWLVFVRETAGAEANDYTRILGHSA